ncbi:MAG: YbdD/YjiX family protein [Cryobacterium sp.]|uniref:YbdD/YjiX family protein n=1 Tax=unclassified Cryobacterium TaxID=2649013 RepID=UPI0018CB42C8|nr:MULTISPECIES: YbdD/YjiX family protein [unclassified Cryobacterium]MCY7403850.1 YbdD/YjiX family protein [Cryobacterium sp.]MEC5154255.1 uncharacterized short protein YbdD (DUF466 family) [Cryobacterium sp. CAN_C3]
MTVSVVVRAGARRVVWWVRALMGEDAYDKYATHHASCETNAAHPIMTEREFWRDQTDRQDKNPQGRCC